MNISLDATTRAAIKREFIDAIKAEGLVLVPEAVAGLAVDVFVKQKKLLSRKTLTPYTIAKFQLVPGVKSLKTIKHMALDGRISKNEFFIDASGKMQILTMAIKRLRNE